MRDGRASTWLARAAGLGASFVLAVACSPTQPGAPAPGEKVGEAQSAVFTNGGFETGTAGAVPPSWTVQPYLNSAGITVQTPQTRAGLDLMTGGKVLTEIVVSATGPLMQPDADLGGTASLRWPLYGNQCALVNPFSSTNFTTGTSNNGKNVNSMSQIMTVGMGDVDPADGKVHVRFTVAPVLQNPAHAANQQPYYLVQLTDLTQGNALLYSDFNLSGNPGIPWKTINGGTANEIDYTDWQLVDISPVGGSLAMGDMVELEIIAAGCSPGGHFGKIYVDGVGSTVPGLFVSGTGPAQVNPCGNITYTLTYENGSTTAVAGVQVVFNTPPETTFTSVSTPAGVVCTGLVAGATGAETCTVAAPLAAGASGSFQITVTTACTASGVITAGNYYVQTATIPPLLGPHVNTSIGCTVDSECPTGDWCNESGNLCSPTLGNGSPVPTDPPHTGPTLNGMCTAAAGTLVCTSHVCDLTDNDCGYKNGDGPCTALNGDVVCRSTVCDADGLCGYANGDGPCTAGNGDVVCRSSDCSANGSCVQAGGCNVDADCTGGKWCEESTHVCMAKLANGVAMPTDGPHVGPTLNGMCTAGAATLVCASGVCDTADNKCGYANSDGPCTTGSGPTVCRSAVCDTDGKCGYNVGDGPCTTTTAGTVCRSGACSTDGTCEPPGGCDVDADCTGGNWCDESAHMCTAKVVNGMPVPTDPPHTSPTLNGTCTTAAGTLTCVSGVCDTKDNDCGYANGDGPCTTATGGTVCRSTVCGASSGVCVPSGGCTVDADCSSSQYCNTPNNTCVSKVVNSQPVPTVPGHSPTLNGTCTSAAGAVACVSGVCDPTDNDCGYATGDGPCTSGNADVVCRSGACSTNGTCEPPGGCNVDADCTTGNWCNEQAHTCTAQLVNGMAVPTDPPHTSPTLNGTCTAAAGTLTCQSGVCDTKDNECGYADGDGPCTTSNGDTVCRSGICGSNGVCVGCTMDSQCPTGQPHCSTTTNTCVECTTSTQCSSEEPVCDTSSSTCVPCNGDNGSTASEPCPTTGQPFCFLSGTMGGTCGKCTMNSDCTGHSGNICDTTSGLCVSGCQTDADCLSSQWCNAVAPATGMCEAKLANGTPLPTTPSSVATCSATVGMRVCISGVCDPKDNECGLATGDGPCDNGSECRDGACDPTSKTCGMMEAGPPPCTSDEQCPSGEYCAMSGACTPKLQNGGACDRPTECQSNDCFEAVCSGIIGSGNGLQCAVRDAGSSGSEGGLGGFGLLLGLVGLGLARRRRD